MKDLKIYSTKKYKCPHTGLNCRICSKQCIFYKKAQIKPSKLAVCALFAMGLILGTFIALNPCQAVSVSYEQLCSGYPDGELGVAGSPDWTTSFEVEPDTDYMLFMIRLNDPYIASYYQGLTIDGEDIPWLTYESNSNKIAWYITEADVLIPTYFTLGLDGSTGAGSFYVGELDYYQISGISSYQGYDKDYTSGNSLDYTINFTDNDYTYLLEIGTTQTLTSVDGGVIVRNDQGTHAVASSTPSLNNTITLNFSNSVERAGVMFAFKTYLSLGLNYPDFATEPGLSWTDPAICTYGENCVIDFFYTNLDMSEETAIMEWTLVEDDSFLASTTLNMALPFTWFNLTVASSVGDFVGDIDYYWITMSEDCGGDDCEIYWQNFGTITWTGTTSSTTYDILPDCDTDTVCPYISTSTNFWSVDNFSCGFARAGCYLIKPSPRAMDILRVLIKQEAYGYMSTPGDIQEELTSWENLEAPASTTIVLDMSNSLGKEFTLLDSDAMQERITEPIRERIFLIINLCFAFAYLVGLFIEIAYLIHIKVL